MYKIYLFNEEKRIIFFLILIIFIFISIAMIVIPLFQLIFIECPRTEIELTCTKFNATSASFNTSIQIDNPNDFSMVLKNIIINLTVPENKLISTISLKEISIQGNEKTEKSDHFEISFKGTQPTTVHAKASGAFVIQFGFFKKNLPFNFEINTNLMNIVNEIHSPIINSQVQFGSINQNKIDVTFSIDIFNPNSFEMEINNISIQVSNNKTHSYCSFNPSDILVQSNKHSYILETIGISLDALNAEVLFLNSSMDLKARVAGFIKQLPLHISSQIHLPDLNTILTSTFPTDVIIKGDYHPSINGLIDTITLMVRNANNVEFAIKDIQVHIYRIDKNQRTMIGNGSIDSGIIKANTVTILTGEVLIPYTNVLIPTGLSLLPDWLEVSIRANATIKGLNHYMWVGMIAYQDFHPLRKDPDILDDLEVWYE